MYTTVNKLFFQNAMQKKKICEKHVGGLKISHFGATLAPPLLVTRVMYTFFVEANIYVKKRTVNKYTEIFRLLIYPLF